MSKRVRSKPKDRIKELRYGPELYAALLCFSKDIVILVAEYSQLPSLPVDLRAELHLKTSQLYQLLNLAARTKEDHTRLDPFGGGIAYNKERESWFFNHRTFGGNKPYAGWPEWVKRNRDQYNEIECAKYHCPLWLWGQFEYEKTAIILLRRKHLLSQM